MLGMVAGCRSQEASSSSYCSSSSSSLDRPQGRSAGADLLNCVPGIREKSVTGQAGRQGVVQCIMGLRMHRVMTCENKRCACLPVP